jgi:hypothetical protein
MLPEMAFVQTPPFNAFVASEATESFGSGSRRRLCVYSKRARFSQTKFRLAENSLTLAHSQINAVQFSQMPGKPFAFPEILGGRKVSRTPLQIAIDGLTQGFTEPSLPSLPLAVMRPLEAAFFKTMHPTFAGARVLPEDVSNIAAVKALRDQKNSMQPMVIAGFLGPQNLLLYCNSHNLWIKDFEFAHVHVLLPTAMAGGHTESHHFMRHYGAAYSMRFQPPP